MKQLTNSYTDCRLINLEPATPKGPYVVVQEGYDPEDPTMRSALFLLKKSGTWIDEIAHFAVPDETAFDIIFEDVKDVMTLLGGLGGIPAIERHDLTRPELQAYLARIQGSSMEMRVRTFLDRYRQQQRPT